MIVSDAPSLYWIVNRVTGKSLTVWSGDKDQVELSCKKLNRLEKLAIQKKLLPPPDE